MSIIKDGTGTGNTVLVDTNNRLHTGSVNVSAVSAAAVKGEAFLPVSSVQILTDDVVTPVLYIENTSDKDLFLDNFIISLGSSTSGVGNARVNIKKNIDDISTIVSTGTIALQTNMNISSSKLFDGNVYKGVTGQTSVGGTPVHTILPMSGTITDVSIPFIISKGQNVVFEILPPTSNTSMEIMLSVTSYYIDSELPT